MSSTPAPTSETPLSPSTVRLPSRKRTHSVQLDGLQPPELDRVSKSRRTTPGISSEDDTRPNTSSRSVHSLSKLDVVNTL